MPVQIPIDEEKLAEFCRRWKIREFSLFGSVLRDDFRPDSDVDVLVEFNEDAAWGFEFFDMEEELERLFGRRVDLLTRPDVARNPNWIRREQILRTAVPIHAQR